MSDSKQPYPRKKRKPGMSYLQIMEIALGELSEGEKQSIARFEKDVVGRSKKGKAGWKGKGKGKGAKKKGSS